MRHEGISHVNPRESANGVRQGPTGDAASGWPAKHLLIVEPEALVRWSVGKYLARWFIVHSVESRADADRVLDERPVDVVIVSDDPRDRMAKEIETHARSRNPSVRVVRTVTHSSHDKDSTSGAPLVEKPFDLAKLADMLGVTDATV